MTSAHFANALDKLIASIRLEAEKEFAENHSMNVRQDAICPEESIAMALRDGVAIGILNILGGVRSAHVAFKILEEVNTRPDVLAARQPEVFPSPAQVRSKGRLDLAA
jgi:hypothetical protein